MNEDQIDQRLRQAIRTFWTVRTEQGRRQGRTGRRARDRGERAAATGGRHLDGFVDFVSAVLIEAGVSADDIHVGPRRAELPGFFRPTKLWDLVVVSRGRFAASVEFKSHIGPSFGNNFNNRTEEAIGSPVDLLTAYREGAFEPSPPPWLGYLMILEDCPASRRPISPSEPLFDTFPEFKDASYSKRYEELRVRLVRERLYNAAGLLLSPRSAATTGDYIELNGEIGMRNWVASLKGHALAFARG